MAAIAIRVATAVGSAREAIQHIIAVALLIRRAGQRPLGKSLARRRPLRPRSGQPILLIITEGLMVRPGWQGGERVDDIARGVKRARLVEERRATGGHLGLIDAIQGVIRQVPGIGAVAHTRAARQARRPGNARVADTVEQRGGGIAAQFLGDTRQPALAAVAGGEEIPVGIGQRRRLVGIVVAQAEGVAGTPNAHRPARGAAPDIIAIRIAAGEARIRPAGECLAGQPANAHIAAGGAVVAVAGIRTCPIAVGRSPRESPGFPVDQSIRCNTPILF
jgi:hypothetical protein